MAVTKEDVKREWMTESEAAAYLKCSIGNLKTIRRGNRVLKNGMCCKPPSHMLMGSVRYERHELDSWLLSQ